MLQQHRWLAQVISQVSCLCRHCRCGRQLVWANSLNDEVEDTDDDDAERLCYRGKPIVSGQEEGKFFPTLTINNNLECICVLILIVAAADADAGAGAAIMMIIVIKLLLVVSSPNSFPAGPTVG